MKFTIAAADIRSMVRFFGVVYAGEYFLNVDL